MKLQFSKVQLDFLIYLAAGMMSIIPLMIFGTTETSSIGFYIGIVFILFCRKRIFPVVCFLYIIMSNIYMQYVPLKFMDGITVTAIANLMIIAVLLWYFFRTKGFRNVFRYRYNAFYGLFLALTIIWYTLNGSILKLGVFQMLWRLVPLYFSVILIVEVYRTENGIDDILSVVLVSAVLFTLTAYIELFRGKTFFYSLWTGGERYRSGILRVGSTQGDPNILGMFLAPSIFIIMTDKMKNMFGKRFIHSMLCLMILMLMFTNSRMTLLSFALGMGVKYWVQGRTRIRYFIICGVALAFLVSPALFFFMFQYQAASSGQRIMLMGEAIRRWLSSPFLGIGLDQFIRQTQWMTMNEYTKQLAEFGIFAFLLYMSFYMILIRMFFINRPYRNKEKLHDGSCILAAIITFMANSFSIDSYFYFIMWVLPALAIYFFADRRIMKRGEIDYVCR